MNSLALQFFEKGSESNFQEVLFLSEEKEVDWRQVSEKAPDLPRGWFELSRLNSIDRVEFTRDFWLDRLPFHPRTHLALADFFSRLDDVGVVLSRGEEPFQAELIYSLADNSCFFRGLPPATDIDVQEFQSEIGISLPRDYLAFIRIHNGFGKLSELGMLKIEEIGEARRHLEKLFLQGEKPIKAKGHLIDPHSLIPFYEAYGLASYQCFYSDWYPGNEMGNVYLSGIDYIISDTSDRKAWAENLAFPTFLEWLIYYLEGMSLSL